MSPGVTFRCTCEHCGAIFFGPDRKATACVKCAKRHKIRVEPAPQQVLDPDDELLAAALVSLEPRDGGGSRRPTGHRAPAEEVLVKAAAPTPGAPSKASSPAHLPRSTELTPEKREEILAAYQEYEGRDEVPLRKIHAAIAEKTNLARALVARVIAEVRYPAPALSDEQRAAIVERYRAFVRAMARPPLGRRASIARELDLSRQQVVTVVREWANSQPSVTNLSRKELFDIECAYWNALEAGEPFDGLAKRIATRLEHTEWQVERWLDMLHDGDFSDVEDPSPEIKEAVVDAYREYLQGDGPPDRSLHAVLGERFGIAPRQVHKTLVELRLQRRREAFGF